MEHGQSAYLVHGVEIDELREAEQTLRRIAGLASGQDWLPAVEQTHEDILVHGVLNEHEEMVMGDCMARGENEVTEEDAIYLSFMAPAMATSLADLLKDAIDCHAGRDDSPDQRAVPLLDSTVRLARQVNQRYRRIKATGIHESSPVPGSAPR